MMMTMLMMHSCGRTVFGHSGCEIDDDDGDDDDNDDDDDDDEDDDDDDGDFDDDDDDRCMTDGEC